MADWAVCYPDKVPECPPADDSDADVEGEFGEEGESLSFYQKLNIKNVSLFLPICRRPV